MIAPRRLILLERYALPIKPEMLRIGFFIFLLSHFPDAAAQPLSEYKNGRISTFSEENKYWLMMEDQKGFLWGYNEELELVRFDGNRYTVFSYNPEDTTSISGGCSCPPHILEDKRGLLWIHNELSLNRYNPKTGQFNYLHDDIWAVDSIGPVMYRSLFEDGTGNIWIGGQNSFYLMSDSGMQIKKSSISWQNELFFEDSNGDIWCGRGIPWLKNTRDFIKINRKSLKIDRRIPWPASTREPATIVERVTTRPRTLNTQHKPEITVLYADGDLYTVNTSTKEVQTLKKGLTEDELITCVFQEENTIIVGTDRNRILQFDSASDSFQPFIDLERSDTNWPMYLFKSKDGVLWVVTRGKTYHVLPRQSYFQAIPFPDNLRKVNTGGVHDELVRYNGEVYFFTSDGLVPILSSHNQKSIKLELNDEKPDLISNYIFKEDTKNATLWLLINKPGNQRRLMQFDTLGRKIFDYACNGNIRRDSVCISGNSFDIDRHGNLWFSSWGGGVFKFNPKDRTFESFSYYKGNSAGLNDQTTTSILLDRQGQVWIGYLSRGVSRLDPKSGLFTHYMYDPSDPKTLGSNYSIWNSFEDSQGRIWFGTTGGLSRWDKDEKRFSRFHKENGLPSNFVRGIAEDKNGDLWIAFRNKLAKYDQDLNRFLLMSAEDDFQEQHLQEMNAILQDTHGNLFFRTVESSELIYVHPDQMTLDDRVPELFFTDLLLFNEEVKPGDKDDILEQRIEYTDEITLGHDQNVLTIRYASLQYRSRDEISYAYQLEGFDEEWQEVGTQQSVTFTNLDAGDYLFKLKCTNRHGFESKEPLTLAITILPPWWQTWQAWALWIALILGSIYWFYRFQLKKRLAEAEAHRLQELDAVKTRLYANITHEFRTPLTIILGMADQLIDNPKEWLLDGTRLIRRNGRHLLHLVNQMLDLGKLESGSMPVKVIQSDIVPYLRYILESFHSYAENQGVQLHFISEMEELYMDYDPDKVLQILSNLLSNAVKYNQDGGEVYLDLDGLKENGSVMSRADFVSGDVPSFLRIRVKDTGLGISADQLPYIFDRFYQVDDSDTKQVQGTGIGLALTKELVKLLDGNISVNSLLGEGSEFIVDLPVRRKAALLETHEVQAVEAGVLPFAEQLVLAEADNTASLVASNQPLLLIIEDNADMVQYLAACLQSDYQLVSASNGEAGIQKAIKLVPDIIISDVMMPKKSGFEVCETIKLDERTSHIPIIMLTAKADFESKIAGLKRGADAYLAKPFNQEELQVRLKSLIETRRKLQARYQTLSPQTPAPEPDMEMEDAFLRKVRAIIEENLSDSKLDVVTVARELTMSRVQFYRKIKALTNKSPSVFIRRVRLQNALHLLKTTDLNISEIAYDTGFSDPAYFTKTFREEFGATPSEVRRS